MCCFCANAVHILN
jgi:hypothetical protein